MRPVYIFNLKVRYNLGGTTKGEQTYKGDVTITDALHGDEASKEDLPKVANYLLTQIAEQHPDIMKADAITYTVRRGKPRKK